MMGKALTGELSYMHTGLVVKTFGCLCDGQGTDGRAFLYANRSCCENFWMFM